MTAEERKAKGQARNRLYYQKHKARVSEYSSRRYQEKKEQIKQQSRDYYARNKAKASKANREWRRNHPDRFKVYAAKYYASHPESKRAEVQVYRARKRGNIVEKYSREYIIKRDRSICHICNKKVSRQQMSLDHLIPICKGGPDAPSNVAVAHLSCNKRRNAGFLPAQLLLIG